jgi:hypothetical protein
VASSLFLIRVSSPFRNDSWLQKVIFQLEDYAQGVSFFKPGSFGLLTAASPTPGGLPVSLEERTLTSDPSLDRKLSVPGANTHFKS